uniref:Serpentine receptor class gamma n=1 Tax=Strongyloides venezuelensis TaxID=75913 RepID=A0A0K0G5U9_STRVS
MVFLNLYVTFYILIVSTLAISINRSIANENINVDVDLVCQWILKFGNKTNRLALFIIAMENVLKLYFIKYSKKQYLHFLINILISLSYVLSVLWVHSIYSGEIEDSTNRMIHAILILISIILLIFCLIVNKFLRKRLIHISLSKKFQIRENIVLSQVLLSIAITTLCIQVFCGTVTDLLSQYALRIKIIHEYNFIYQTVGNSQIIIYLLWFLVTKLIIKIRRKLHQSNQINNVSDVYKNKEQERKMYFESYKKVWK